MRTARFTETQIVWILSEAKAGLAVNGVCASTVTLGGLQVEIEVWRGGGERE